MSTPFDHAKPILESLHRVGYEAYYVGGAVRDFLLNREIGDVDIATSAKPNEVQHLFDHTIDVGAEHGTIIVLLQRIPYEVTTYRTESDYEDYRRPKKVTYISSLKEDLKRRDFTINAMAMDVNGVILDYFNGKTDLSKKLIQTVGLPANRFKEDALRMLRAVRFVSQLQFSLCPITKEAIKEHAHLLQAISVERKTVEIEKLLKGLNKRIALEVIVETKINQFLPGLEDKKNELFKLASYHLQLLKSREELWTFFTYCIAPSSINSFLRNWKLPVKLIKTVNKNIHYLSILERESWSDLHLYEAGYSTAISVEKIRLILADSSHFNERIKGIEYSIQCLPIKSRDQLAITGHDIIQYIDKAPGPWVSEVLNEIEKEVVTKKLANNSSAIKEWLIRCKQDFEQNY